MSTETALKDIKERLEHAEARLLELVTERTTAQEVWTKLSVMMSCTSPDGSAELEQVAYLRELLEKRTEERDVAIASQVAVAAQNDVQHHRAQRAELYAELLERRAKQLEGSINDAHDALQEHSISLDLARTVARGIKMLVEKITRSSGWQWQPMETAPTDGTEVLLKVKYRAGIPGKCLVGHYMPGGHCIEDHPPIDEGWYFYNGRMFDRPASEPIKWAALPRDEEKP